MVRASRVDCGVVKSHTRHAWVVDQAGVLVCVPRGWAVLPGRGGGGQQVSYWPR